MFFTVIVGMAFLLSNSLRKPLWGFLGGLSSSQPSLRIHRRRGGDGDDVVYRVTGLQDVHRRAQAEQDRADGLRAAEALQEFVSDVRGIQIRENQHVRFLDSAEGETTGDELRHD